LLAFFKLKTINGKLLSMASEMAVMTRNQVLAQSGVSMLAQANSLPQMALQLLR
jgi:flagellin